MPPLQLWFLTVSHNYCFDVLLYALPMSTITFWVVDNKTWHCSLLAFIWSPMSDGNNKSRLIQCVYGRAYILFIDLSFNIIYITGHITACQKKKKKKSQR